MIVLEIVHYIRDTYSIRISNSKCHEIFVQRGMFVFAESDERIQGRPDRPAVALHSMTQNDIFQPMVVVVPWQHGSMVAWRHDSMKLSEWWLPFSLLHSKIIGHCCRQEQLSGASQRDQNTAPSCPRWPVALGQRSLLGFINEVGEGVEGGGCYIERCLLAVLLYLKLLSWRALCRDSGWFIPY